jgi:hypothetical protein
MFSKKKEEIDKVKMRAPKTKRMCGLNTQTNNNHALTEDCAGEEQNGPKLHAPTHQVPGHINRHKTLL